MAHLRLNTTYVNTHQELFPYLMSCAEGKTIEDLLRFYFPNGPIQKSVAYFGGTGISQTLSVNNAFYAINHVLKQMLGMPSLQTGLDTSIVAGGKGYQIPFSFLSAMGESVERFSGVLKAFDDDLDLVYGSYRKLTAEGRPCLAPEDLPLFADEQYDSPHFLFKRFTEDTVVGWVEGQRLISGAPIWVPAQLTMFFYFSGPDEEMIGYSASAGMCCHIDEATAIYGGITELIERDGMMVSWYCRIPPERIVLDRPLLNPDVNRFAATLDALPGSYSCYSHALDMPDIPVVSVIQRVPYLKKFSYYAGGAAGIDIDEALTQALVEYGQSEAQLKLATVAPDRGWSRGAMFYFDVEEDKPLEEMTTFLEHLGYFGYPRNAKRLDWFLQEGEAVELSSFPFPQRYENSEQKLQALVEKLKKYDIDPIIIDYTPPQMEQLRVAKVFIPELTQPHVSSRPYLGHPRLLKLPYQLGLRDRPLTLDELEPGPVPFP